MNKGKFQPLPMKKLQEKLQNPIKVHWENTFFQKKGKRWLILIVIQHEHFFSPLLSLISLNPLWTESKMHQFHQGTKIYCGLGTEQFGSSSSFVIVTQLLHLSNQGNDLLWFNHQNYLGASWASKFSHNTYVLHCFTSYIYSRINRFHKVIKYQGGKGS